MGWLWLRQRGDKRRGGRERTAPLMHIYIYTSLGTCPKARKWLSIVGFWLGKKRDDDVEEGFKVIL